MSVGRTNFEVQTCRDGRWAMQEVFADEDEARTQAKKLLGNKACEGVRILRNWMRGDGQITETEIFRETRVVSTEGAVHVSSIETAPPPCESLDDYFGPASRDAVNRLLRAYLEKATLTPTELMYSYKELRRLQEKDTLVPSAVDRVAQLQCRAAGSDPRLRAREIFKSIDEMSARARRVEALALPPIKARLSEVMGRLPSLDPSEDPGYLVRATLARDLLGLRNWVSKLERLCALAAADSDPAALAVLDDVISDLLGSSVVQDVLGDQPGLGAAIIAMLDLADGAMAPARGQVGEAASILNRLFAERKLPAARATLIDRAHRQIRSSNPLVRDQPAKEVEAFRLLVGRLLSPAGFVHGPESAEALTWRQTRMVEQGGGAGRRAALEATFRAMPDRATGLVYLCAMAETEYGAEQAEAVQELLDLVVRARGMPELCDRTLPPKERLARATRAHAAVLASAFPEPLRRRVADAIDTMLEQYLLREQIIDKLDNPAATLRDRAVRLVQFCAAGVLPEGRALGHARHRVLDLLRQPHFDAHFIDGCADAAQAQRMLRDFHQLLVKGGFK